VAELETVETGRLLAELKLGARLDRSSGSPRALCRCRSISVCCCWFSTVFSLRAIEKEAG
jgi:hypothetical protein